jgi:hypothetical protein
MPAIPPGRAGSHLEAIKVVGPQRQLPRIQRLLLVLVPVPPRVLNANPLAVARRVRHHHLATQRLRQPDELQGTRGRADQRAQCGRRRAPVAGLLDVSGKPGGAWCPAAQNWLAFKLN